MAKRAEKPAARRRLSPEERRAQLLDCAIAVFADRGIRRAVHADVAKAADCAVSTVFLYFPTRDELVDAVLEAVDRFFDALASEVHASSAPAEEVLLEHGRRFRDSIDSHPDFATILLDWASGVRSRVWPRYLSFSDRMVAQHRATIERGIEEGTIDPGLDAEAAARIIIGYAQTSAQMRLARVEPERSEQLSRRIVTAMLQPPADESAA